jgi:hypothetical protein
MVRSPSPSALLARSMAFAFSMSSTMANELIGYLDLVAIRTTHRNRNQDQRILFSYVLDHEALYQFDHFRFGILNQPC